MQQISDPRPDGPGRRRLPRRPVRIPEGEGAELQRYLAEYTDIIDERLEDGLAAIQRSAAKLLRHVAAEVWRASGPEAGRNLTESVIGSLAQDDTLRALLTHTDERYQALQVRVADMEAVIRQLAEATREAVAGVNERAAGSGQFERQRQELRRFTSRLGETLGEMHRQLTTGIRGEIQRLESAFTSQTAFGDDTLQRVRAEIAASASATREGLRSEIEAAIVPTAERMGEALETVRASLDARIGEGLERLAQGERAQREQLHAYTERVNRGLGEVARRLHGQTAALAERAEAAEAGTARRLDELREEIHAFRERAGAGLAEVGDRIRDGFRLMLANLESREQEAVRGVEEAIRSEIQTVHREIVEVAERTGAVLDGVRADVLDEVRGAQGATRKEAVDIVSKIVERQAGRHQETIKGVTRSLRHLLDAIQKSGERQSQVMERVLRASAERQEAILDESLAALRSSLEELGSQVDPGDRGPVSRRLRGMERRLGELSDELTSGLRG